MIFWRNVDIDAPGFECTKKVLILECENNEAFVTTDAIKNKSLFDKIKLSEGARFAIIPGKSVPVITVEPVNDNTNITNIYEALVKVFRAGGDGEMQAMRKVKSMLEPQVGADLASKIVSAIKLQYEWETNGELTDVLRIDASDADVDLRATTMKCLDDINSRFVQAITSIAPAENYTRFQNSETDMLFIEIPSRGEVAEADPVVTLIPQQDEVCKPYSDPAAYSPDYKNKGLPKYLLAQIEGSKSNNKDEVFENEKVYYTALDEWVHFNMREEFGDAEGNVIDKLSEGYLLQLISSIYIWHWRHNPRVPRGIDPTRDDDDTADVESMYVFYVEKGKDAPEFNAVIILQEFLKEASTVLGYKVYLDALMQIARWGSRKPTAIVFNDYDKEFVLGRGTVGQKIGDLSEYETIKQDDCDCKLVGMIYDNAQIRDVSLGATEWKFPVGIVTSTAIESKLGNREEYFTFYHFLDLLKLLDSGELSVSGITKTENGWILAEGSGDYTVSELVNVYEKTGQAMLQFPFYRSQKLLDLLLELQIANSRIPTNIFIIMNTRVADPNLKSSITKANFASKEELFDAISQGRITSKVTATELNIAGALLPCYLNMNRIWDGNVTGAIEAWRKASSGFEGETAWYGAVRKINSFDAVQTSEEPKEEIKEEPTIIQSMAEVNDAVKTPDVIPDTPSKPKAVGGWMKAVPADAPLCKVMADNRVVGYCYVEKGVPIPSNPRKTYSRYTIAANKEGRVIGASTVSIYRIVALLLHNIYLEDVRGSKLRQVFFEDADTLNAVKTEFQEMGKQ